MLLTLDLKPFSFELIRPIRTSQGLLKKKQGWLLHLQRSNGDSGWGEVSPLNPQELKTCESILKKLGTHPSRESLETEISTWPGALAFGMGAALAELDCLIGCKTKIGWLKAPQSAFLLPYGKSLLTTIDAVLKSSININQPVTFKWKVGIDPIKHEESLLREVLHKVPISARLRLDANGGWDRKQAHLWAQHFLHDPRLEWLEQPLPAEDIAGLKELSEKVPIALDESLAVKPMLRQEWTGWQIRRPALDGDPRILLKELQQGMSLRVVSTAFETGIGRRWLHHLAALQQQGPTPTAPGLAPGCCPNGNLFRNDPLLVWKAA